MKDGSTLRMFAMAMIGVVYGVYMITSALCTGTVPDGIIFGTVAGSMGALAGYDVALRTSAKVP